MNRPAFEYHGPSDGQTSDQDSRTRDRSERHAPAGEPATALRHAEELSKTINRFSDLSSELTSLLTLFSREIQDSAEQLARIHAEVESKNKELKALHGIEASLEDLSRLTLEHQRQKETLEHLIADQRSQLEAEKARRAREEREYAENLRIRREREEEEHRQRWAAEKLKAQQKLEEELRTVQQDSLQKQQALERECLERELVLKEKELEWVQLIQELEQFMSRLVHRTQTQAGTRLGPVAVESAPRPVGQKEETPDPHGRKIPDDSSIASLREMLVSQGRRIENLKS